MAVKEGAGWVSGYVNTAKKKKSISDRTRGNAPIVTVPYKGRPKPKPKPKRPTAQPNKQPRARTKAIERREQAQAPSQFEVDLESYKNTPGDRNMGMGGPPPAGQRSPGLAAPAQKPPKYKPYQPPSAASPGLLYNQELQAKSPVTPQAPPAAHGSPWSHADPNAELPYEPWKPLARIGQAAAIAAKSIATGEKTYTVEDNPYQQKYPVVPMGAFGQVAPTTFEPRTDRSAYQLDPGVYSKERKWWDKTAPTLAGAAEAMNVGLESATAMVTRTDEVMGLTPRLSGETGAYTYEESMKEYYAEHTPTERMVMEMANPLMWSLAGPKLGAINEANTLKKASNIASDVTLLALGEPGPLRRPVNALWDSWHGALRTPYTKARNLAQDTSYVVNSVVDEVTDMSHILVKGDMGPVRKPVYIAKANDVVSTIEDFSVNPTRWRGDAAPDAADLLKSVDLEELSSIKTARMNPYDNVNMLEFHGDLSDALMEKALIKKGALKPGQTIKDFKPNVIERINANMKSLTNAAWLVSGRYLVRNTANNYTTLMVDGINIRGFDRQKFDSMRVMFNLDPISSHADELAEQMMGTGSMTGKALDKVPGFKKFREVSTGTGLVGEQRARDIATFDVAQKAWNENWVNKGRGVTPNYDGSYRPKGEVLHRGIPVASELDDAVSQSTRTARSVSELEKNIRDTVVGNRSPITAHFPDGYSPNLDEMNRLQRAADGGTLQAESRAILIELEAQGRVAAYTDRLPVTVEDYGVGPNVTHQRSGNWLHPGANDEQMGAVQKGMNAYNRNVQKLSEDLAALSDMPYAHTVIPEEITRQQQLWYKHTEAADKLLEKAWKDINDGAPEVFVWERYYGETMPAHFDNAVKEQMAQIEKSSQLVRDVAEGKVSPRPGIDVDAELKDAHEAYFKGFDERKFDVNGEKDFKSTLKTSRIATSGARMDASKAAMLAASQGDKAAMGRLVATLDETKRINGMAREFIDKNQPAWMAEGREYFRQEAGKVWDTAAQDNLQAYSELQEALAKNVSPDFHRTDANYGVNRIFTADDETNAIFEMVKEVGAEEDAIHTINRAIKEENDDIVDAFGGTTQEIPFISSGDDLKKTLRNATPEQREVIYNHLGRKVDGDEWIEYRRKNPAGAGRDEMRGSVTPQQSQVLDDMGQDVIGGMPDSHMPSQSAALRHELAEKRLHLNDLVENWEQGGGPTHRPWVPDDEVDELVGSYMNKYEQPFIDAKNAVAPYTKERVDFSLLDYGDRTYIDMLLDMRYPYSFWQTRSMWNWAQRIMHKPGYAFAANRMNKAIDDQYRLEDGSYDPSIPARMRKKIKVDVPQGLIDKVPGDLLEGFSNTQFLANPINMFLPINDLTPSFEYSDPDDANSRLEEARLWEEVLGAGRYPWVDLVETPLTGEKQVAVKEALPHLKAVSSLTALLAKKYPDSIFPAGGFMFGPQWGKWDTWRLQRMMVSQAAEAVGLPDADFSDLDELEEALIKRGNVDTTILMPYAQTIQQVIAWENGELSEAEIAALKEDPLYQTAATESGVENGVPSLLSFLTGLSVSPIMEGEMAVRAEKELAKSKMYDPNTALGSREEYLDIKELTPETTIHREDAYQRMGLQNDLDAHEEKWRPALDALIREKPAHFDEQADMRWEASKEKSAIYAQWFGAQDELKDDPEMWSIYGARPEEMVQITIEQALNELYKDKPKVKDFAEHPEAYDDPDASRQDKGEVDYIAYAEAYDEWLVSLNESALKNSTISKSLASLKEHEGQIGWTPQSILAYISDAERMEDYIEEEKHDTTILDALVIVTRDIHYTRGDKRRAAYDEAFGEGTAERMDEYTAIVNEELGEEIWDDVKALNNELRYHYPEIDGQDIYERNAARQQAIKDEYGEDIYSIQDTYFSYPEKSVKRRRYLKQHPELKALWDNLDDIYEEHNVPRDFWKVRDKLVEKYELEEYYELTRPLKEKLGIVEAKIGKHDIDDEILGLIDGEATDYTPAIQEQFDWMEKKGWDEEVINEVLSSVNMIPNSDYAWLIAEAYERDVDLEVVLAEQAALEFHGGPLPEIEKDPKKGKYRWKRYPRRSYPRRSYGGYPRSAKSKVWAEYYQTVEAQYGKEIWNTVSSYKEEYKALFGEDIFERNAARIAKAREYFGENIFDLQAEYFALPPDQQAAFLAANPMLQSYWDNSASLYEMFGMPTDHFDKRQEIRVKYGLADYFDYIRELKEELGVDKYSNYKPL